MKKLLLLYVLLASLGTQAQDFKHFEAEVSAHFWTLNNSHYGNLISELGWISDAGYKRPKATTASIGLSYYNQSNLGISFNFNKIHLNGDIPDYESEANIYNYQIGFSARTNEKARLEAIFTTGINITNYKATRYFAISTPLQFEAKGLNVGLFFRGGLKINLIKNIYFTTAFEYSYIPSTVVYSFQQGSYTLKINYKTNLGGLALQTGIGYRF